MAKQIALVLSLLVAINAKDLAPRDLIDEVMEQIQELNSTVHGEILAAHGNLDDLMTDFGSNSLDFRQRGDRQVQVEYGDVTDHLDVVKEMANAANVDISACLNVREDVIHRLPGDYVGKITFCIDAIDAQADQTTGDARYTVDVVINKVNQLDFQVRRCGEDINCISPLLTEAQLDRVRLPESIKTEVLASGDLLTALKLSVQSCAWDNIAEYANRSFTLLNDITMCINRALDGAK